MDEYNRNDIRVLLLNKLQDKVKPEVLENHIEGLIDEYIEKCEFVKKHGSKVNLPSKDTIYSWFRDRVNSTTIEVSKGVFEKSFEIKIDTICLEDKIALDVFKNLYNLKWSVDEKVHPVLKTLLKMLKLIDITEDPKTKQKLSKRFGNIAVVGAIRLYHMERSPHLSISQIDEIILYVTKVLYVIEKIENGEFKDKIIKGEIYIFDGLQRLNKDIDGSK